MTTGVTPKCATNKRRKCLDVTPNRSLKATTPAWSSSPAAINFKPRVTVALVPDQAGVPGADSGRQRKQGLNPAIPAAAAEAKNITFSGLGRRTRQTGRQ